MRGGKRWHKIDHQSERAFAQAMARARAAESDAGWLATEKRRRPERVWETAREVTLRRWSLWWGVLA